MSGTSTKNVTSVPNALSPRCLEFMEKCQRRLRVQNTYCRACLSEPW